MERPRATPVDRKIKVKEMNRRKQEGKKTYLEAEGLSERVKAAHGTVLLIQCIEKQDLLLKNKPSPQNSQ